MKAKTIIASLLLALTTTEAKIKLYGVPSPENGGAWMIGHRALNAFVYCESETIRAGTFSMQLTDGQNEAEIVAIRETPLSFEAYKKIYTLRTQSLEHDTKSWTLGRDMYWAAVDKKPANPKPEKEIANSLPKDKEGEVRTKPEKLDVPPPLSRDDLIGTTSSSSGASILNDEGPSGGSSVSPKQDTAAEDELGLGDLATKADVNSDGDVWEDASSEDFENRPFESAPEDSPVHEPRLRKRSLKVVPPTSSKKRDSGLIEEIPKEYLALDPKTGAARCTLVTFQIKVGAKPSGAYRLKAKMERKGAFERDGEYIVKDVSLMAPSRVVAARTDLDTAPEDPSQKAAEAAAAKAKPSKARWNLFGAGRKNK